MSKELATQYTKPKKGLRVLLSGGILSSAMILASCNNSSKTDQDIPVDVTKKIECVIDFNQTYKEHTQIHPGYAEIMGRGTLYDGTKIIQFEQAGTNCFALEKAANGRFKVVKD